MLEARGVDPRYVNGEVDAPVYRVDFTAPDSSTHEWRLVGADDVLEVLSWARENAAGRTTSIAVESTSRDGTVLHRLLGPAPS